MVPGDGSVVYGPVGLGQQSMVRGGGVGVPK